MDVAKLVQAIYANNADAARKAIDSKANIGELVNGMPILHFVIQAIANKQCDMTMLNMVLEFDPDLSQMHGAHSPMGLAVDNCLVPVIQTLAKKSISTLYGQAAYIHPRTTGKGAVKNTGAALIVALDRFHADAARDKPIKSLEVREVVIKRLLGLGAGMFQRFEAQDLPFLDGAVLLGSSGAKLPKGGAIYAVTDLEKLIPTKHAAYWRDTFERVKLLMSNAKKAAVDTMLGAAILRLNMMSQGGVSARMGSDSPFNMSGGAHQLLLNALQRFRGDSNFDSFFTKLGKRRYAHALRQACTVTPHATGLAFVTALLKFRKTVDFNLDEAGRKSALDIVLERAPVNIGILQALKDAGATLGEREQQVNLLLSANGSTIR